MEGDGGHREVGNWLYQPSCNLKEEQQIKHVSEVLSLILLKHSQDKTFEYTEGFTRIIHAFSRTYRASMKKLNLPTHPILQVRAEQQMKNAKAAKKIMLAVGIHKVASPELLEDLLDSLIEDPLVLENYQVKPKGSQKRAKVLMTISSTVSNLLKQNFHSKEIEYLAFGIEAFS